MLERSGLGWSLAFILLRDLSPAGNSLHLTGNELLGLSHCHALGVPARNISCSPPSLPLSMETCWHWDPQ